MRRGHKAAIKKRKRPMEQANKVKQIISEQLGIALKEVTNEATLLDDLGMDSLDAIEIIMAMEEEYNIEITDEEGEKLITVGEVIKYIQERTSG